MNWCSDCERHVAPSHCCPSRPQPSIHETAETKDVGGPTMALLDEREKTHGSFAHNSRIGQHLRKYFREQPGWGRMDDRGREALDLIACKLSRILSGMSKPEHWEDIAGYATLVISDQQR